MLLEAAVGKGVTFILAAIILCHTKTWENITSSLVVFLQISTTLMQFKFVTYYFNTPVST